MQLTHFLFGPRVALFVDFDLVEVTSDFVETGQDPRVRTHESVQVDRDDAPSSESNSWQNIYFFFEKFTIIEFKKKLKFSGF